MIPHKGSKMQIIKFVKFWFSSFSIPEIWSLKVSFSNELIKNKYNKCTKSQFLKENFSARWYVWKQVIRTGRSKKKKKRRTMGFALETIIYRRDKDVLITEKSMNNSGKIMPPRKT